MRPKLRTTHRLFWVGLARVWAGWRQSLRDRASRHGPTLATRPFPRALGQALRPAHRGSPAGQRRHHRPRPKNGRRQSAVGHPRIHGELLKLGIEVAERTVSRLIPKRPTPPSQTWRTFLTNHVRDLVRRHRRTNRFDHGPTEPLFRWSALELVYAHRSAQQQAGRREDLARFVRDLKTTGR
jgi:hypothetical protein